MQTAEKMQEEVSQRNRVLLLENDSANGFELKEWFMRRGYDVDLVETRVEAEDLLTHREYAIVVADVRLPDGAEGDSFVLDNTGLIGAARAVVFTGNGIAFIRRQEELKRRGIPTFRKGDPEFIRTLRELAQRGMPEREPLSNEPLGEGKGRYLPVNWADETESKGGDFLVKKAHNLMIKWLVAMQDPDKKGIFYGGKEYSPNMLAEEVRRGTDVGRAHVDMLLDLFEHELGLE
jgi:CheY-like chemotaxis protein